MVRLELNDTRHAVQTRAQGASSISLRPTLPSPPFLCMQRFPSRRRFDDEETDEDRQRTF
jgi:hypothetical protein